MIIQLLVRNSNQYAEQGLFVINKILEPSKEVALQLPESGRQNIQTRKLSIEMLRQLSLHNHYVSILLEDGYYLEALHFARKNMKLRDEERVRVNKLEKLQNKVDLQLERQLILESCCRLCKEN